MVRAVALLALCCLFLGGVVASSVLDVSVDCGPGTTPINNPVGQSFYPVSSGSVSVLSVWIRPNPHYVTTYELRLYSGEMGDLLAISANKLSLNPSDPISWPQNLTTSAAQFYDFDFGVATPSLAVGSQYSWKLVPLSQYSGYFSKCSNSVIAGRGFWYGLPESGDIDYSFKLWLHSAGGPPPTTTPATSTPAISYTGCYQDCGSRAFSNVIPSITFTECLNLARAAGETSFGAQHPEGSGDKRFECWFGNKGVLGSVEFPLIDDASCAGEGLTDSFLGITAPFLGSVCTNAVYTFTDVVAADYDLTYESCNADDCDGRAFAHVAEHLTLEECAQKALDNGEEVFGAQCAQCSSDDRMECWYGDRGVNGQAPFQQLDDSACDAGEGWSVTRDGMTYTLFGSICKNAVYRMTPKE